MSWRYGIIKHDTDEDERLHYFAIHEIFEKPFGYAEPESSPYGETKKELIKDLENMLSDAKNERVLSLKKLEKRYGK